MPITPKSTATSMRFPTVTELFDILVGRLAGISGDAELERLSSGLDCTLAIRCGPDRAVVVIRDCRFGLADPQAPAGLELVLDPDVLRRMVETPPPPRHQGFTALQIANPAVATSGDALLLAQARAALERVFELALAAPEKAAPVRSRNLMGVAGRYLTLECAEGPLEIYTDISGKPGATPLVFLHTAGADARQFQAQLADTALGAGYELHAPDMPFHGRSLPPLDWDGAPYRLTAARYLDWVKAYLAQVVGRPAILAGCSMGAAVTLLCAARAPELLCAALPIEPPFRATGRINRGQNDVAVHAGLHNGAFVRGLMAPTSPEGYRRRAGWIYSQAAPGIYQADLAFYSLEFDGAEVAPTIDARRLPVVLLSGAYDYSATPEDGARLCALMPGARQIVMPDLGHFPMSEHPDLFASYLDEALTLLAAGPIDTPLPERN